MEPLELSKRVRQGEAPFSGNVDNPIFEKDEIDAWASSRILEMNERRLSKYEQGAVGKKENEGPFRLERLVSPERVFLQVDARTKSSMLAELVNCADSLGLLYDPHDLLESLRAREDLCSTALPGGFAIPHPRHHDPYLAQESFLIVALPTVPIHFGAQDGKPSDLFFLLVCQEDRQHLRALARLCSMLLNPNLAAALRAAEDPSAICSLLI
ncbi:MAG: PTS sugar transporter subunit IIA [Kiritimatiellae bacterium]|nr:PTS sugar transporter subunit IIA [Kiritimatiellia bacterium]